MKAGAIIPMGPVTAFVDQEPLEIVSLDVYPETASTFTLYEDDGTSVEYQKGAWATTDFSCRVARVRSRLTLASARAPTRPCRKTAVIY